MDRIARIVLGVGSPLIVLSCIVGGEASRLVFVVVTPLIPVALIALGASRRGGGSRWIGWVLVALALTLEAGSLGILFLARSGAEALSVGGLPASTLVMLLVLGVVPLLLIPVCYAALFGASNES
jgi:hypothetical protein